MSKKVHDDMTTTTTTTNEDKQSTVLNLDNIKGWIRVPLTSSSFSLKKVLNDVWAVYVSTVLLWIILGSDSILDTKCDFRTYTPSRSADFVFASCDERSTEPSFAHRSLRIEIDAYWMEEVRKNSHLGELSTEEKAFYTYDANFYTNFVDQCERQGINETTVADYLTFNLTVSDFLVTSSRYSYAKVIPGYLKSFEEAYGAYNNWCKDLSDPIGLLPPANVVTLFVGAFVFLMLFFVSLMMKAADDSISKLTESDEEFSLDFELKDIYTIYTSPLIYSLFIATLSVGGMGVLLYFDLTFQPPGLISAYCKKEILYDIPYQCFFVANIMFALIYYCIAVDYVFFRRIGMNKWSHVMKHIGAHEEWKKFVWQTRKLILFDLLTFGVFGAIYWKLFSRFSKHWFQESQEGVEKRGVFTDNIYLKLRQKYLKIVNGQLFVFLEEEEARGLGIVRSLVDLSIVGKPEAKSNTLKVKASKGLDA